jgi:hypothetical protein
MWRNCQLACGTNDLMPRGDQHQLCSILKHLSSMRQSMQNEKSSAPISTSFYTTYFVLHLMPRLVAQRCDTKHGKSTVEFILHLLLHSALFTLI